MKGKEGHLLDGGGIGKGGGALGVAHGVDLSDGLKGLVE